MKNTDTYKMILDAAAKGEKILLVVSDSPAGRQRREEIQSLARWYARPSITANNENLVDFRSGGRIRFASKPNLSVKLHGHRFTQVIDESCGEMTEEDWSLIKRVTGAKTEEEEPKVSATPDIARAFVDFVNDLLTIEDSGKDYVAMSVSTALDVLEDDGWRINRKTNRGLTIEVYDIEWTGAKCSS